MDPIVSYLGIACVLFTIGGIGLCLRRNAIVLFMCVEMMLNAVNLAFVAFSKMQGNLDGQVAVFFVMVIAAAESAIGLAIVISVFRSMVSIETSDAAKLKW